MKLNATIFLFVGLLFLVPSTTMAGEIAVTDADSVWMSDLIIASSDVTDSTDAPSQNLIKYAFVSHAESVWNSELISPSSDVLDSTDAPEKNLIKWAFVSHADSVLNIGLEKSDFEALPKPEKWSFAIITDLHIGYDIPDYDGYSYNDTSTGQDYYLVKRLEAIVQRINEIRNKYSIKFVTVLGDISDTAEYSELLKARDILNKLNDPNGDGNLSDGIPYIPLIGNHDVWPYTQKEGIDPDERGKENWATIDLDYPPDGDRYFEGIFWCSFNTLVESQEECLTKNTNIQKIKEQLKNWHKDENTFFPYLQNYAFSYKKINFIVLDYISEARKKEPGYIGAEGNPIVISPPNGSVAWFTNKLKEYEGQPIILLSHYPNLIDENKPVLSIFVGHIHRNFQIGFKTIITAAIIDGYENVIRIVQVKEVEKPSKEDIDYSEIEGIPKEIAPDEIKRPKPYITYIPSNPAPNEDIIFFAKDEIREKDIKSCKWDFGDGTIDQSEKCEVVHSYSPILLWKYTVKVTITYIDGTQRIAEKGIWVLPRFKLKIPEFIIPNLLIDERINVAEIPQNTPESVFITKTASEKKPIGIINVHFEEATEDIDLSNLVADVNLNVRKSILYMSTWPNEIEGDKILFIPSTGVGTIYLCPHAPLLAEITPFCEDIEILDVGESKDDLFVDTITYNNQEYYMIYGVKGTGGGEFGYIEESIKNIHDYIQGLLDNVFKNNPNQRKNALKNKLEEVFVKIENNEYQEAINKLRNDIRAKTDGSIDGNLKDDWITDSVAQKEICIMIDELIIYLQGLL